MRIGRPPLARRVLPSISEFYLVLPSFTGFCKVLLGFTGFYLVLPSCTGFCLVLPSFTGFYWVLPSFTGFCKVLLGFTGFHGNRKRDVDLCRRKTLAADGRNMEKMKNKTKQNKTKSNQIKYKKKEN